MRGSATGSGTPLSSNPRKHSAGIRSAAAVMPTASNTDPEALAPTSSSGSRDLDNEKAVLLGRTGSKNIRVAVSQAPKEVCNLCSHRMHRVEQAGAPQRAAVPPDACPAGTAPDSAFVVHTQVWDRLVSARRWGLFPLQTQQQALATTCMDPPPCCCCCLQCHTATHRRNLLHNLPLPQTL